MRNRHATAHRYTSTTIIAPAAFAGFCVSGTTTLLVITTTTRTFLRAALRYVEPPVARDLLIEARIVELKARRLAVAG